MTRDLKAYGLDRFFEPADATSFAVREETSAEGDSYLIVTETGAEDGGQHLFRAAPGGGWDYKTSDTVIVLQDILRPRLVARKMAGICRASSAADHAVMHAKAKAAVGVFQSDDGPDNGNLACVWAVRRLANDCLGREIHRSDSTTRFGQDLRACQLDDLAETDIPPGGIVISPTAHKVGHVGILGEGSGPERRIYSNSSGNSEWRQNFTLGAWIAKYRDERGLKVLFFHLPHYTDPATS